MSTAKIYSFSPRNNTAIEAEPYQEKPSTTRDFSKALATLCDTSDSTFSTQERLSLEDLVPTREVTNETLRAGLMLLDDALQRVESAVRFLNGDDQIGADDEFQRLHNLLPELFCCRGIGDGFAITINGLWSALENLHGAMPTSLQLAAFASVMRTLRKQPLLPEDQATELLMLLESRGLGVQPAGFDVLADWLSE